MKKTVTKLGDYFFYGFAIFSAVVLIAGFTTPARAVLLDEFGRFLDPKGKLRATEEFEKKLAIAGIDRATFKPKIKIIKRNRELQVLSSDNVMVAHYPVGLGRASIGAKQTAKDQKTPEGEYSICKKDENNRYHLFLQITYPSLKDAQYGSVNNVIQHSEYTKIVDAIKNREAPPTNTKLGGPIGIHGFGAESSWTTDGSISLHNVHIEELYWNVENGTPVVIVP